MIKAIRKPEIEEIIEDSKDLPYPCLLKSTNSVRGPIIIMATASCGPDYFKAFVIQSDDPDVKIGFTSTSFPMKNFGRKGGFCFYNGEVILKNDI